MPRGNTATISIETFKADWNSGLPIAVICSVYSISKDQVVRLRDIWHLPLRNDRRKRKRQAGHKRDPTPNEIRLRCLEIQATWTDKVREDRHWKKQQEWVVPIVDIHSDGVALPDEPEMPEEE